MSRCAVVWIVAFALHAAPARAQTPGSQTIAVFDEAPVEWDRTIKDGTQRENEKLYKDGQVVETTIDLPAAPANQRDAQRILATLIVEPVILEDGNKLKPADPWTRLGSISVINAKENPGEIELMRFITGFGGHATFTQDLTALAPLLQGKTTLRVYISTYKKPAWKVTMTLTYSSQGAGYRRPMWVKPLFNEESVNAQKSKASATIEVPRGLARPRLRILSTGHATDGTGGDEFVSRTHILRIDGVEVARWRPWNEDAAPMRSANPMSGRVVIDGRELWSSDLDRSGWRPGAIVEPLKIPVPELSPGKHTIEIEVVNIRPKDQLGNHGYWRLSCIGVADEPWPNDPEPPR